ncbi:hypothetical protein JYU14_01065 [Simkania negevensis]|uniref:Flagellar motor switch protein FliG C-terminal domain-containing protein n=1 Tax=Simkania negevensis TaxID=83561 RepID=A0ABS3ARD7_9BACT|nr:hypothetical protein [Simkania negevensis]
MGKRLIQEELDVIASQILAGEKQWGDLDHYSDDDKNIILDLIRKKVKGRDGGTKRVYEERLWKSYEPTYVYDLYRGDIAYLVKQIDLGLFPPHLIKEETPLVQRRLLEEWNRKLSRHDLAIVFSSIGPDYAEAVLQEASQALREDILFRMEHLRDDATEREYELACAKFSVITAQFLDGCEEISSQTRKKLNDYLQQLREGLLKYASKLPRKLGVLESLSHLSSAQWAKLAGLTPRQEMASLFIALPQDIIDKLIAPLPLSQREDVMQLVAFKKKELQKNMNAFGRCIESLISWTKTVEKIGMMQDDAL